MITKVAYRTRMQEVCPAMEAFRKEGVISISAADLTSVGLRHLHTDAAPLFMTHKNIFTQLPEVHVPMWEGRDELHLVSPHQTILFLDRMVLRRLPKRYFMTLDSELDKIIPHDVPVYCTKPEDQMNLIELSYDELLPPIVSNTPIKEFCRIFWTNSDSMAYWRFFNEDIIDPINRAALPNRQYMETQDIQTAKQTLRRALLDNFPIVPTAQAVIGLSILQTVYLHPKANKMTDILAEEAKHINSLSIKRNGADKDSRKRLFMSDG